MPNIVVPIARRICIAEFMIQDQKGGIGANGICH
jgi:hypothetical protein